MTLSFFILSWLMLKHRFLVSRHISVRFTSFTLVLYGSGRLKLVGSTTNCVKSSSLETSWSNSVLDIETVSFVKLLTSKCSSSLVTDCLGSWSSGHEETMWGRSSTGARQSLQCGDPPDWFARMEKVNRSPQSIFSWHRSFFTSCAVVTLTAES